MTEFKSKYAFAFEDDDDDTNDIGTNNQPIQSSTPNLNIAQGGLSDASALFGSASQSERPIPQASTFSVPSSLFADEKELELDAYPLPQIQVQQRQVSQQSSAGVHQSHHTSQYHSRQPSIGHSSNHEHQVMQSYQQYEGEVADAIGTEQQSVQVLFQEESVNNEFNDHQQIEVQFNQEQEEEEEKQFDQIQNEEVEEVQNQIDQSENLEQESVQNHQQEEVLSNSNQNGIIKEVSQRSRASSNISRHSSVSQKSQPQQQDQTQVASLFQDEQQQQDSVQNLDQLTSNDILLVQSPQVQMNAPQKVQYNPSKPVSTNLTSSSIIKPVQETVTTSAPKQYNWQKSKQDNNFLSSLLDDSDDDSDSSDDAFKFLNLAKSKKQENTKQEPPKSQSLQNTQLPLQQKKGQQIKQEPIAYNPFQEETQQQIQEVKEVQNFVEIENQEQYTSQNQFEQRQENEEQQQDKQFQNYETAPSNLFQDDIQESANIQQEFEIIDQKAQEQIQFEDYSYQSHPESAFNTQQDLNAQASGLYSENDMYATYPEAIIHQDNQIKEQLGQYGDRREAVNIVELDPTEQPYDENLASLPQEDNYPQYSSFQIKLEYFIFQVRSFIFLVKRIILQVNSREKRQSLSEILYQKLYSLSLPLYKVENKAFQISCKAFLQTIKGQNKGQLIENVKVF